MARSKKDRTAYAGKCKADARYWLIPGRLVFHDAANYSARIQHGGRRVWFPLGTPNKKSAAAKAAEIYSFIQTRGFDPAIERFKNHGPWADDGGATVGQFIKIACEISSARPQRPDAYTKASRRIVSEIKGLEPGRRYDAKAGGKQRVAKAS